MRRILRGVVISVSILTIATLVVGCFALLNRSSEELITLKQLYNTQQEMLEDNFTHQELDSLYLEYNYYYLHEYYQNNY